MLQGLALLLLTVGVAYSSAMQSFQEENDGMMESVEHNIDEIMDVMAMIGADPIHHLSKGDSVLRGAVNAAKKPSSKRGMQMSCKKGKDLDNFPQWKAEVGYWIGEYTLVGGDGTPRVSSAWPYPYNSYIGFITGNIKGKAYRQRNVFLYPPATLERCEEIVESGEGPTVVGDGQCGINGNSLVFSADQSGCSKDGSISGSFFIQSPFGPILIDTTTELIGADNALLYQVFSSGQMTQSQLTTINQEGQRRTRTAQSFAFGTGDPAGTSYYRERKVSKEEFYMSLMEKITEYNILESDLCFLDGFTRTLIEGYIPSFEQCQEHLEQSFALE